MTTRATVTVTRTGEGDRFAFEPKESILARFDVDVIRRYFPEFDRTVGTYLRD